MSRALQLRLPIAHASESIPFFVEIRRLDLSGDGLTSLDTQLLLDRIS